MSLFSRISAPRGPANNTNNNSGNKQVCKFYLEGKCKFGEDCHYYHPPRDSSSQTRNGQQLPYHLTIDGIKSDLTTGDERPIWPLSAYGPGRDAPRQLLEGALEQSPEELRTQYYLAKASGNPQTYEQTEREALETSNARARSVLNDLDGAVKYVIDGKDIHPNREDIVVKNTGNFQWRERSTFNSASSASTGSTFGQASGLSGGSTFGQPSTQPSSTFGQPSLFSGRSPAPGSSFGQASNLGTSAPAFGAKTSAFGAPSTLGSTGSAFGRPSPLGAGAAPSGASAFGQPSNLGGSSPFGAAQNTPTAQGSTLGQSSTLGSTGSTFGKPSPFGGAASASTPAFGQTSAFGASSSNQPSNTSAFGQASNPAQTSSAFGQPSQLGSQTSTFGQASNSNPPQSTFGQPSPFGSAATGGTSAFGQPSQSTSNTPAFGAPSPFGTSTQASTFGRPSLPTQQQSPFASSTTSTPSPFGAPSTSNIASPFASQQTPIPQITLQPSTAPSSLDDTTQPQPQAQAQPTPQPSLRNARLFTENKTTYYTNPRTQKKERVWFPEGAPAPNTDVEAADLGIYDNAELGKVLREVYGYVREFGVFKGGEVPEVPPKREWVSFDL